MTAVQPMWVRTPMEEGRREAVGDRRDLAIAATRVIRRVVGLAPAASGGWPAGIASVHCAYSVYMGHTGYRATA
jgi:hypothetical protein